MLEPPESGASQDISMFEALDETFVGISGVSGTVAAIIEVEADSGPSPILFNADTVKA